jgi:hypothetical protein
MILAMAAVMGPNGNFKEAISLLERSKSYGFGDHVKNALLVNYVVLLLCVVALMDIMPAQASAMVACYTRQDEKAIKQLYRAYETRGFSTSELLNSLALIKCEQYHDKISAVLL